MGNVERLIAQQCARSGDPLPQRILEKPELPLGLQFILGAFFDLDTERHHGNGLMPIPWSSILRYAEYQELDEDETEELVYFIRQLDNFILNKLAAEQRARMNSSGKGTKP